MIDLKQRCALVRSVTALQNRAVFQIPDILERIMAIESHSKTR